MKQLKSKKIQIGQSHIYLRGLELDDVTQAYVDWLNDPQINRFLESRLQAHTLDEVKQYVQGMYDSDCNEVLGIFYDDIHVGNIKIGNIHPLYRHADIGLLVDKAYWGKGIATAAIGLAEEIAFNQLGLHKLWAGVYHVNTGSIKAFRNNQWNIAAELKDHAVIEGAFVNAIWLEKINVSDLRLQGNK